jgi:hypothetical protein
MTRKTLIHGILVFGILLTTACSLTSAQAEQETIPNTGSESGISIQMQADQSGNDSDESSFDGSSLGCFEAESFILKADHTLTVNQPDTSITHILKQGGIALMRDDNSQNGDYNLTTESPQVLSFEVIGNAGPCEIDASGTMTLSATGYCHDGIVYLTITEDWGETKGTMSCKDVINPFTTPGHTETHTGPYGMGEEFLIVNDPVGFTVMREFLEGEGYHSWTLAFDIAPAPLIPDDK